METWIDAWTDGYRAGVGDLSRLGIEGESESEVKGEGLFLSFGSGVKE